jgi:HEAT repeat protein
MKTKLLVGVVVVILMVPIWVVLLDPTRVGLGRLSGESFYLGRPTSFWSLQLRNARAEALAPFAPPPPPSWTDWIMPMPPRTPLPPALISRMVKEPDSALLRTRDETAVPVLLELLRDHDPWIRWRVAISLSMILEPLPTEKLEGWGHPQLERLVRTLEAGLSTQFNEDEHRQTCKALARLSPVVPSALAALLSCLQNNTPAFGTLDRQLLSIFNQGKDQNLPKSERVLIPSLIKLLKGEDLEAGQAACCILAVFKEDAGVIVPALTHALARRNLRVAAAESLWRIEPGNTLAVPALVQQLHDGDMEQQLAAVNALDRLGSDAAPAVLPLAGLLEEVQGQIARREKEGPGLVVLEEEGLADVIDSEEQLLELAILSTFRHIGPAAVAALEEARQDADPEVRRRVNLALKKIQEKNR